MTIPTLTLRRRCWQHSGGLLLVLTASLTLAADAPPDEDRAAQLERMKHIVNQFEVKGLRDGKSYVGQQQATPLLRYNDVTRKSGDSTLWLWTERALPCGLMGVEFYPTNPVGKQALFEFVSLSDINISLKRENEWSWSAKQPGLQRLPLNNAPEPAAKSPLRVSQAKQLFQRFAAHEKHTLEGRLELRPLTNPLYRYQDEATGVLDGVIFTFVNGTNPEVFVILEACTDPDKTSNQWRYSLAQMTGAEVYVSLDDQEVWSQKEADPPAVRKSYVNDWITESTTPRN